MSRPASPERLRLIHETARIVCEEQLSDYRLAKSKAAQRLGLGPKAPMPANAEIQEAVIEYQRLFGGRAYAERLQQLRQTAVRAMKLLADFTPRLVGAVASGATTDGHRVQLHAFADAPEQLDLFLGDRGIPFEAGERRYRFPDGSSEDLPTVSFMAGDIGVDVAVFNEADRRSPLSPLDGLPMKRLDLARAEALLAPADA